MQQRLHCRLPAGCSHAVGPTPRTPSAGRQTTPLAVARTQNQSHAGVRICERGFHFPGSDPAPHAPGAVRHHDRRNSSSGTPFGTGPSERSIAQDSEFRAHDGAIDGLALSGDGRLIVTTGSDRTLKIWNAASHTLQGSIPLDSGTATSLSVRNNRAVTGHADGSVAVYDLDKRARLYSFKRNDASVWAAVFAGSEDRIAAAGHDWTVIGAAGRPARCRRPDALLQGHDNAVQSLAADPAGRWLASGSADSTVKLWKLELQRTAPHAARPWRFYFNAQLQPRWRDTRGWQSRWHDQTVVGGNGPLAANAQRAHLARDLDRICRQRRRDRVGVRRWHGSATQPEEGPACTVR